MLSSNNVPMMMRAAYLEHTFEVIIKEVPVPVIRDNDVLIKVAAVGVCGSDVHYYEHGKIGHYVVEKPIVLGHECAGSVVALGKNVHHLQIGDRVTIEPGVSCGQCYYCKQGRYNLCPDIKFLATPPVDGAFSEYIAHRANFVFKIPDEMSFEKASLVEPFSVGIHASRVLHIQAGESIAIMGMGPVGLMAVLAAKAHGATQIIVGDVELNRLEAAKKLGATSTINVREQNVTEAINSLTGGLGVDIGLETAGNPEALKNLLASVRRGGRIGLVGLPPIEHSNMNIPAIIDNEIQIQGIFRYANTYPSGISILNSVDTDVLITDRYSLTQTGDALERARTNKSDSIKVMVYPYQ